MREPGRQAPVLLGACPALRWSAPGSRGFPQPGVAEGVRAPERTTRAPPRRGGWDRGSPLHTRGLVAFQPQRVSTARGPGVVARGPGVVPRSRSGPGAVRAPGAPPLPRSSPISNLPSCGQVCGVAGVERLVHLPPRGPGMPAVSGPFPRTRGEVQPELGGLAPAPPGGRLHLLSESLSHVCGRCSC